MEYKAFHKLSYGLYIVASEINGKPFGYIGNTVFQVTSNPAQIAISCHKNNDTHSVILKSGIFSISVLRKEVSTSLIGEFGFMASSEIDKFAKVNIIRHITGAPIVIDSVVAWFDCRVVQTVDVGTHTLIIGEVADSRLVSDEEPLTYDYYREKYKMLAPRNAPTFIEKEKLDAEAKLQSDKLETISQPQKKESDEEDNEHYICAICGYVYRPEDGDLAIGIPPGTPFSDLPDDYRCPICNAGKDYFKPLM